MREGINRMSTSAKKLQSARYHVFQHGSGLLGRAASSGFTLVEIMIVVVVVGILAAIAMGSYSKSVQRSNRGAAKTALLDLAAREEKYFSLNNAYSSTITDLYGASTTLTFPLSIPLNSGSTRYTIAAPTIAAATTTTTTTTPATFQFTAVPANGQVGDACGSFSINSVGQQTVTGTASGCW